MKPIINKLTLKNPIVLFLSFFGAGFFPKAPGTAGTIAALPFLYILGKSKISTSLILPEFIIITIIACVIANIAQKKYKTLDPQWIVIDEVLGIMTAWFFRLSDSIIHLIILAILFRFFDILKIWPISWMDKNIKNGFGIIIDDIVSGIFAALTYLLYFKIYIFFSA